MPIEIKLNVKQGLLWINMIGESRPEDLGPYRRLVADIYADGGIHRLVLDGRELRKSLMTGPLARSLLTTYDSQLADLWAGTDQKLRMTVLTHSGSTAYGIARLIEGHAYGLSRIEVSVSVTESEAVAQLGLEEGWKQNLILLTPEPC